MSKIKVFCFGFGQVAESFVNKLIKEKKDLDLAVTSRDQTHQIEYNNFKMTSFFFKDDKFDKSIKLKLEEANYIQNIDNGMSEIEAKKNFLIDNKREWEFYVKKKKNGLFILYDQLFSSPASSNGYERR